jgi:hypothetical protein
MGVTVRCLKCGREYAGQKKNCIYCGASLEGDVSQEINDITDKEGMIYISETQNKEVSLKDLPEHARHKLEDAIRKGKKDVVVKEERTVIQAHSTDAKEEPALSLEKVLTLLSEMKNSYNKGHFEYNIYERMVFDIMKDFIYTLDDDIKIEFVVNDINNSEISDYLNDKIIKDLRTCFIASTTDKKGFQDGAF